MSMRRALAVMAMVFAATGILAQAEDAAGAGNAEGASIGCGASGGCGGKGMTGHAKGSGCGKRAMSGGMISMGAHGLLARKAELGLTDEQVKKIQELFEGRKTEHEAIMVRVKAAQDALQAAAIAEPVDEGVVRKAGETLGSVMAELSLKRAATHKEIQAVLTPEQVKAIEELKKNCQAQGAGKGEGKGEGRGCSARKGSGKAGCRLGTTSDNEDS